MTYAINLWICQTDRWRGGAAAHWAGPTGEDCPMVAINGATVPVTGGQRGLGKAFVEELLARGAARVYATARLPRPSGNPSVVSLGLDVTDPASVQALAAL